MICFLAKLFIKNHDDTTDPKVRQGYGIISGASGIAFNFFLFITKLIAGLVSGSISILGDALNNLSDAASSIVTLIGFKLSGQEADEEHPFGHGRLEYIAGLIVALLIVITGVELFQSSIGRIIHPDDIEFNAFVAIILIISIFIKLIMFNGNLSAAKLIGSATLKSVAADSISDVFTTAIVLLSAIISYYFKINIDGYVGVIVAVLIMKAGYEAARDTINPLLGETPDNALIDDVLLTVIAHEGILGAHDLVIHNYGPTRIFMSLHVEVAADKDLITVHDLIDDIENELHQKYHCTAVIHTDPVVLDDEETTELKRKVRHTLKELDPALKFHDFRLIHSDTEQKKLSFDVVVPYNYDLSDEEIVTYLKEHIRGMDSSVKCDITIDKEKK